MDVKEFSQSDAIFSKKTDDFSMDHLFLSIMRSRHQLSMEDPTTSLCHVGPTLQFDMEKLEGDMVRYFIAGKPHLKGSCQSTTCHHVHQTIMQVDLCGREG